LFFGGDLLSRSLVERLAVACPGARCVNFYGATETPQAMSFAIVDGGAELRGSRPLDTVPLGRGIDGVQLLVLNELGGLAGVGEVGEICIRTPYLSRGYLNDPDLTARRFTVNPFTGEPADRVYRTGDRGRYRPDGQVEFAGRTDGQVKIRGYRVEPGEIEARLLEHPTVARALVVARGESASERRLVAYCVPREGTELDTDGVRGMLAAALPGYMVPSAFVPLASIPLTPNGKVDLRALPSDAGVQRGAAGGNPPRTPTEDMVAAIWREVLRTETIGAQDNFFDIGGHSLLAMQVTSRIRQASGVELPVRSLFESPTVAALAARIDAVRGGAGSRSSVPLRRVAREERRVELDAAGAPLPHTPGDNRR
jgi:acyl carrier protein